MNYKLGLSYTGMESSFVPFFLQYLALSAQLPNVIFNWINVFFKLRYKRTNYTKLLTTYYDLVQR